MVVQRKAIFEKLKKLNCISLLQETHSTNENENKWKNESEGNIIFSHGTSNSRGTAKNNSIEELNQYNSSKNELE